MFKLKFADVKNQDFVRAYMKIITHTEYKDTKTAYNIAKIARKFDQESKLSQELYVKLIKKYAKLDDKGEIAPRKEGERVIPNTYEIRDEAVEDGSWKKAAEDFDATEFEIACHKVKLSDLNNVGLSPVDLLALEDIIDLEETPAAPKLVGLPAPERA